MLILSDFFGWGFLPVIETSDEEIGRVVPLVRRVIRVVRRRFPSDEEIGACGHDISVMKILRTVSCAMLSSVAPYDDFVSVKDFIRGVTICPRRDVLSALPART